METTRSEVADWPAQVTQRIVDTVETVRSRTTDPAIKVARALVFGTLAALLGLVVLVLVLIAAFRMLDAYLPADTWAAHMILGGLLTVLGAIMWMLRTSRR